MYKQLALLLLTISIFSANGQTKSLPAEAKAFVPKGYEMMDYIAGDLNGDKKADAILILKIVGEENSTADESTRPLIILTRQANGKLKQEKEMMTWYYVASAAEYLAILTIIPPLTIMDLPSIFMAAVVGAGDTLTALPGSPQRATGTW